MALSLSNMLAMLLRGVRPWRIAEARRRGEENGLSVTPDALEAVALAGGDPRRVVEGMIEARRLGLPENFEKMAAVELAGRDPVEAARRAATVGYEGQFKADV